MNSVRYVHFFSILITKNLISNNIQKTLKNLAFKNSNLISETSHNPEEVISNFNHEFSDEEEFLLCERINFSPKRLVYLDHMFPFELLFRITNKIETPYEDKESVKSRIKCSALTFFRSYNYNSEIDLTKNE